MSRTLRLSWALLVAALGAASCTSAQTVTGGAGGTGGSSAQPADLDALCAELQADVDAVAADAEAKLAPFAQDGWGRGWRAEFFGCERGTRAVWALVPTGVTVHEEDFDTYLGPVEVAWEVRYADLDGGRATLSRETFWPEGYCSVPTAELVAVQDLDQDGREELVYESNIHCTEGDTMHSVVALTTDGERIVDHALMAEPLHAFEDFDGDGLLDVWLATLAAGREGCAGMGTWVVTAPMPRHNLGQGRFADDDAASVAALRELCPAASLDFAPLREDFEGLVMATACARLHGHSAEEVTAALAPLCTDDFLGEHCASVCEGIEETEDCVASCLEMAMCDVAACEVAGDLAAIAAADIPPLLAAP